MNKLVFVLFSSDHRFLESYPLSIYDKLGITGNKRIKEIKYAVECWANVVCDFIEKNNYIV